MKPKYRNLFLAFGILAIGVMLATFDVDYAELVVRLKRAGIWLPAIVGIWVVVYFFNALAFQLIVNSAAGDGRRLSFLRAYKLTVSGFAFSYTTPFGFGGGPYRMMELNSLVGTSRAASSVVLYSMMHIFSHICLWASDSEVLRDDSLLLFEKLKAEGHPCRLYLRKGMIHTWLIIPTIPEAKKDLKTVKDCLDQAMEGTLRGMF